MGLSVKWASWNVGASVPEEYGDYFAWGETDMKWDYYWTGYKWCNDSSNSLTKYNNKSNYGIVDNKTTLDLDDDAAHAHWGGTWRMPTIAEWLELRNNCSWEWTSVNGINGRRVSGPNGNSIFLPAAGQRNGTHRSNAGFYGYYMSSDLNTSYPYSASIMFFNSSLVDTGSYDDYRSIGRSVRPVCD